MCNFRQIGLLNPSKSGKPLKPKAFSSVLGEVGLIKVVSELLFMHPIFGNVTMGTFGKSAHIQVQKKWHFMCPNENSFATFISPTSPKNDGIGFGFKRLTLLGWFWASFKI